MGRPGEGLGDTRGVSAAAAGEMQARGEEDPETSKALSISSLRRAESARMLGKEGEGQGEMEEKLREGREGMEVRGEEQGELAEAWDVP